MPEERPPTVSAEDAVLEANELFYRALQTLDLDAMDDVWLHKDWVFCVHPGWQGNTGWEQVRRSWEAIFANTRQLRIRLHQVALQLCGAIAWITCVEEITSESGDGPAALLAQSTNIYMRVGEKWKLVHHHASPVPLTPNFPETARVQ